MEESNKVYVNAGILAMCLPGTVLTAQQQEDVMNSLLFAELSARVKHPQAQHNTEREQAVQRMLDNLCWIRLNQPGVVSKASRTLTVVDVVTAKSLSMFPSRVSSGFIELLKKLKFLPSQKALDVWYEKTVSPVHSEHSASTDCPVPDVFNVCVKFAILDAKGVLHTLMLAFTTRTKLLNNYLSQTIAIEESAGLHVQAYTYEQNAQCFSRLRESVAEKLKSKKNQYVLPWACSADGQCTPVITQQGL